MADLSSPANDTYALAKQYLAALAALRDDALPPDAHPIFADEAGVEKQVVELVATILQAGPGIYPLPHYPAFSPAEIKLAGSLPDPGLTPPFRRALSRAVKLGRDTRA